MADVAADILRRGQGPRVDPVHGRYAQAGHGQRSSGASARGRSRRVCIGIKQLAHLTLNAKLSGGPTEFFLLDPVGVFFNEVGIAAQAPHPNAARLAANYLLSKPAQLQLTARGRVPTRLDVETNPPGMLKPILTKKLIPVVLNAEQEKKADVMFKELIAGRV